VEPEKHRVIINAVAENLRHSGIGRRAVAARRRAALLFHPSANCLSLLFRFRMMPCGPGGAVRRDFTKLLGRGLARAMRN